MISYVASKQFRFQKQSEKKLFTGLFLLRGEKKETKKKRKFSPKGRTRISTRWIFHLHGREERYNGVAWINRELWMNRLNKKEKEKARRRWMRGRSLIALQIFISR